MLLMLKSVLKARQHSILHPERIVGNPKAAGPMITRLVLGSRLVGSDLRAWRGSWAGAAAVGLHGGVERHGSCGCLPVVIDGPRAVRNCAGQDHKQDDEGESRVKIKRFGDVRLN